MIFTNLESGGLGFSDLSQRPLEMKRAHFKIKFYISILKSVAMSLARELLSSGPSGTEMELK
jgi:hypothetical protein